MKKEPYPNTDTKENSKKSESIDNNVTNNNILMEMDKIERKNTTGRNKPNM